MDTIDEQKIPPERPGDLTITELKAYPGLAHLTDEQATHIIASLKELSILLCYYAAAKKHMPKPPIIRILDNKHAA